MKHVFILMLSLFSINFCLAQTVTGTVTDSDGQPMVGVNVIEKNTTNGVVTDMDGRYRITVPGTAVLVFSYVGSTSQEVAVNNRTVIDVTL